MEDKGKNILPWVPLYANKPPIVPKPFQMAASSQTQSKLGQSEDTPFPPILDVLDRKIQISTTISKQSITIAPSCTSNDRVTVKTEGGIEFQMKVRRNMEGVEEQKKLRRAISNRISAKKSRMKKLHYVGHLEKVVKDLEIDMMVLKSSFENELKLDKELKMENSFLKERVSLYEDNVKRSLEMMRDQQSEVKWLREVYCGGEQKMLMQLANPLGHSSLEDWPQPMEEHFQMDPDLNFNSLTIDLPKSLM